MKNRNPIPALGGIVPPVITPMTPRERVDAPGLRRLVRHLLAGGVDGLFMHGSTSEAFALPAAERIRAVEIACEEAGGAVPVLAGVSAEGTLKAAQNARDMYRAGARIAVSTIPYYIRLGRPEAVEHFKELADRSPMPVMIYSHPLTGFAIDLALYQELGRIPNIVGAKDSFANPRAFQQVAAWSAKKPCFRLFQGSEFQMAVSAFWGAAGCVPAIANIAPRLCADLWAAARRGEMQEALALQQRVTDLCNAVFGDRFPSSFFSGLKYALARMGICADNVSRPFLPLSAKEKQRLGKAMTGFGIV